jgi:hypothetical protein
MVTAGLDNTELAEHQISIEGYRRRNESVTMMLALPQVRSNCFGKYRHRFCATSLGQSNKPGQFGPAGMAPRLAWMPTFVGVPRWCHQKANPNVVAANQSPRSGSLRSLIIVLSRSISTLNRACGVAFHGRQQLFAEAETDRFRIMVSWSARGITSASLLAPMRRAAGTDDRRSD